jgi:hypothetical protein
MTTNLADITKTDLAAEVDRLRAENIELAARPCLACALAPTHAALITEARQLLDGAIRHRNATMTTDGVARMISNEQWPNYLKAVEQWERKLAVATQGGV